MEKYCNIAVLFHVYTKRIGCMKMLKDLLTLEIKFSESHLFFPKVIFTILIILGIGIIIENLHKRRREQKTGFNFKFFIDNYDKVKFFGTIAALIFYVLLLEKLGFIIATLIFMFIATILFEGNLKGRTLAISAVSSVATTLISWYFFAHLINITLP